MAWAADLLHALRVANADKMAERFDADVLIPAVQSSSLIEHVHHVLVCAEEGEQPKGAVHGPAPDAPLPTSM
jgi:hypothetical protein